MLNIPACVHKDILKPAYVLCVKKYAEQGTTFYLHISGLRTVEAAQHHLRDTMRGEVFRTRAAGFGCLTIALVGFSMLATMVMDDRTKIYELRETVAMLNGRL